MTDNAEQAEFWNGRMGEAWVAVEQHIDRMLEPLTLPAIDRLDPRPGQRIIDIGCGCGTTSLMLAGRGADVWGIDISAAMIRQASSKPGDVTFTTADAASHPFAPDHDALFSRFGIMFFDNPVAAFGNLRSALKPGGSTAFMCWQAPLNNPWMSLVGQALQPYQPEDMPVPDPTAPGPFSLADPDRARQLLAEAGFSAIDILPLEQEISLGQDVDEAMAFQQLVGPLSDLLESTEAARHDELIGVVRDLLKPYERAGGVRFPAAAWLIRAGQGASQSG